MKELWLKNLLFNYKLKETGKFIVLLFLILNIVRTSLKLFI